MAESLAQLRRIKADIPQQAIKQLSVASTSERKDSVATSKGAKARLTFVKLGQPAPSKCCYESRYYAGSNFRLKASSRARLRDGNSGHATRQMTWPIHDRIMREYCCQYAENRYQQNRLNRRDRLAARTNHQVRGWAGICEQEHLTRGICRVSRRSQKKT